MKGFSYLLFILFGIPGGLGAQTIQLVLNTPSPYISDWQIQNNTAILIVNNTTAAPLKMKIKAELFDGSGKTVAVNNLNKMNTLTVPAGVSQFKMDEIFPTRAIDYKGNVESKVMTTGRIPDDHYKFCVSIVDPVTGVSLASNGTQCRSFHILAFQAPLLIAPRNGEKIAKNMTRGILFRWFPVTPPPRTIVTYQLLIFEILPGQEAVTALRTNQPIVSKEIKGVLQTQWPIDFMMPEPGKKYIWTIIPLDPQGRKMVDGYGMSQPHTFEIEADLPSTLPPFTLADITPTPAKPTQGDTLVFSDTLIFRWKTSATGFSDSLTLKTNELWPPVFTLQLYELSGGQKNMEPSDSASLRFVGKDIRQNFFRYPATAPVLERGKTYAWVVIRTAGKKEYPAAIETFVTRQD